ncbi:MAG: GNAT family N-acetyltransferase [Acidobacteria bacterium]|nr:GNAT family N-acetyltransferase [Acidobacteriota bacterium]
MKIEIITGREAERMIENADFRRRWENLYGICPWGTVFQSEDFVATWYSTYRNQFTPVIVVGTNNGGELAGLFTLAISTDSAKLEVAGTVHAEYPAWLANPQDGNTFIESALLKLSERFPNQSLTLSFLAPSAPLEWTGPGTTWGSRCYIKPIPRGLMAIGDGSAFRERLRKKTEKYKLNRLKRLGDLRFDQIEDREELEAIFDEIMAFATLRLKAVHNATDLQHNPHKKSFYKNLMRMPRLLHATVLRLDGEIVSAQINWYNRDQVLIGLITHSPLHAKASPGVLHMLMLGTELAKQEIPILDLTPGGDYKDRYATHHDKVYTLKVFFNPVHCLQYKLKRKLTESAKPAIRRFNIAPEQVRDAFHSFTDWRQKWSRLKMTGLVLELFRRLKESLWCTKELCVYSYDLDRARISSVNQAMNRDHIPDLLAYQPIEAWQPPVNRFLRRALEYLESGNHIYTCVKEGDLVHYGWLIERQGESSLGEVEQALSLPPGSVLLTDFYTHPQALGDDLCRSSLSQMLHDAALMPGAKQAYVYAAGDNHHLRQAVEEMGFAYSYTLSIRNVLGRTTRWSNASKPWLILPIER